VVRSRNTHATKRFVDWRDTYITVNNIKNNERFFKKQKRVALTIVDPRRRQL
jgi:hypothetical protein